MCTVDRRAHLLITVLVLAALRSETNEAAKLTAWDVRPNPSSTSAIELTACFDRTNHSVSSSFIIPFLAIPASGVLSDWTKKSAAEVGTLFGPSFAEPGHLQRWLTKSSVPYANCSNGRQDEGETCVDGGGQHCRQMGRLCAIQQRCADDDDCKAGLYCSESSRRDAHPSNAKKNRILGLCVSCSDSEMNGDESSENCGGSHCRRCPDGESCATHDDCASKLCHERVCVSCFNGILDGNETDVDCGGSACRPCGAEEVVYDKHAGRDCRVHSDCVTGFCDDVAGKCKVVTETEQCGNEELDVGEACIDAGGALCRDILGHHCFTGQSCRVESDCIAGLSCAMGHCVSCFDEEKNQDESDVDCGGSLCDTCADGHSCTKDADCTSRLCVNSTCVSCFNGRRDGEETDVDCGGPHCAHSCGENRTCVRDEDCVTGHCSKELGRCVVVTRAELCSADTMDDFYRRAVVDKNYKWTESSKTCSNGGGSACRFVGALCGRDETCLSAEDCEVGLRCINNTCTACEGVPGACGSFRLDKGRGKGCPACPDGEFCTSNTHCLSRLCVGPGPINMCASCTNGILDGNETDVDCGGTDCVKKDRKCGFGMMCREDKDCITDRCNLTATPPTCTAQTWERHCVNGVWDGPGTENKETCLDGGGKVCRLFGMLCGSGEKCEDDKDCVGGGPCEKNKCSSCQDGIKNGKESDVDCAGKCQKCEDGKRCKHNFHCLSNQCVSRRCVSCFNGFRDGNETDVDCGGGKSKGGCERACGVGKTCREPSDCVTGICDPDSRICVAGDLLHMCSNGVKDLAPPGQLPNEKWKPGSSPAERKVDKSTKLPAVSVADEACVDGGGLLCREIGRRCAESETCRELEDCDAGLFCDEEGFCESCASASPHECGAGHPCGLCPVDAPCFIDSDCTSARCFVPPSVAEANVGKRRHRRRGKTLSSVEIEDPPGMCVSCHNGRRDGSETDVDCGGGCTRKCGVGQICAKHTDCNSGLCNTKTGLCASETRLDRCTNGLLDVGETCVDGGGSLCRPIGRLCASNARCKTDLDCASGLICWEAPDIVKDTRDLASGRCVGCWDGVQNGDETSTDCGGVRCPACIDGQSCVEHADCESNLCFDGKCSSCFNARKDGSETDVDCGGACRPCGGSGLLGCERASDCWTGHCDALTGTCTLGILGSVRVSNRSTTEDTDICDLGSDAIRVRVPGLTPSSAYNMLLAGRALLSNESIPPYVGRALGPKVVKTNKFPPPLVLNVIPTLGVERSVTIRTDVARPRPSEGLGNGMAGDKGGRRRNTHASQDLHAPIRFVHYAVVSLQGLEGDDVETQINQTWVPTSGLQLVAARVGLKRVAASGRLDRIVHGAGHRVSAFHEVSVCGLAPNTAFAVYVVAESGKDDTETEISDEDRIFGPVYREIVTTAQRTSLVLAANVSPRKRTESDVDLRIDFQRKSADAPTVYWAAIKREESDGTKRRTRKAPALSAIEIVTASLDDDKSKKRHHTIAASGRFDTAKDIVTLYDGVFTFSSIISLHRVLFPNEERRHFRTLAASSSEENVDVRGSWKVVPPSFWIYVLLESPPAGCAVARRETLPPFHVQVFGGAPEWISISVDAACCVPTAIEISTLLDRPTLLLYAVAESNTTQAAAVDHALASVEGGRTSRETHNRAGLIFRSIVDAHMNEGVRSDSTMGGTPPPRVEVAGKKFYDSASHSKRSSKAIDRLIANVTELRPCTAYDVWIVPEVLGGGKDGGRVFGELRRVRAVKTHCRPATVLDFEVEPSIGSTVLVDLRARVMPSASHSVLHYMVMPRKEVPLLPEHYAKDDFDGSVVVVNGSFVHGAIHKKKVRAGTIEVPATRTSPPRPIEIQEKIRCVGGYTPYGQDEDVIILAVVRTNASTVLGPIVYANVSTYRRAPRFLYLRAGPPPSNFEPSYAWQIVLDSHVLPPGLEIKMSMSPANGGSSKLARIGSPWQLQLWVDDPVRTFVRLDVEPTITIRDLNQAIAGWVAAQIDASPESVGTACDEGERSDRIVSLRRRRDNAERGDVIACDLNVESSRLFHLHSVRELAVSVMSREAYEIELSNREDRPLTTDDVPIDAGYDRVSQPKLHVHYVVDAPGTLYFVVLMKGHSIDWTRTSCFADQAPAHGADSTMLDPLFTFAFGHDIQSSRRLTNLTLSGVDISRDFGRSGRWALKRHMPFDRIWAGHRVPDAKEGKNLTDAERGTCAATPDARSIVNAVRRGSSGTFGVVMTECVFVDSADVGIRQELVFESDSLDHGAVYDVYAASETDAETEVYGSVSPRIRVMTDCSTRARAEGLCVHEDGWNRAWRRPKFRRHGRSLNTSVTHDAETAESDDDIDPDEDEDEEDCDVNCEFDRMSPEERIALIERKLLSASMIRQTLASTGLLDVDEQDAKDEKKRKEYAKTVKDHLTKMTSKRRTKLRKIESDAKKAAKEAEDWRDEVSSRSSTAESYVAAALGLDSETAEEERLFREDYDAAQQVAKLQGEHERMKREIDDELSSAGRTMLSAVEAEQNVLKMQLDRQRKELEALRRTAAANALADSQHDFAVEDNQKLAEIEAQQEVAATEAAKEAVENEGAADVHGKMVEKEETRAEGLPANTSSVLDASDNARVPSSDEGGDSDEDDESTEDDESVEDDESDEVDESTTDDESDEGDASNGSEPTSPSIANEKVRSEVNADAVDEVETGDLPNFDSLESDDDGKDVEVNHVADDATLPDDDVRPARYIDNTSIASNANTSFTDYRVNPASEEDPEEEFFRQKAIDDETRRKSQRSGHIGRFDKNSLRAENIERMLNRASTLAKQRAALEELLLRLTKRERQKEIQRRKQKSALSREDESAYFKEHLDRDREMMQRSPIRELMRKFRARAENLDRKEKELLRLAELEAYEHRKTEEDARILQLLEEDARVAEERREREARIRAESLARKAENDEHLWDLGNLWDDLTSNDEEGASSIWVWLRMVGTTSALLYGLRWSFMYFFP